LGPVPNMSMFNGGVGYGGYGGGAQVGAQHGGPAGLAAVGAGPTSAGPMQPYYNMLAAAATVQHAGGAAAGLVAPQFGYMPWASPPALPPPRSLHAHVAPAPAEASPPPVAHAILRMASPLGGAVRDCHQSHSPAELPTTSAASGSGGGGVDHAFGLDVMNRPSPATVTSTNVARAPPTQLIAGPSGGAATIPTGAVRPSYELPPTPLVPLYRAALAPTCGVLATEATAAAAAAAGAPVAVPTSLAVIPETDVECPPMQHAESSRPQAPLASAAAPAPGGTTAAMPSPALHPLTRNISSGGGGNGATASGGPSAAGWQAGRGSTTSIASTRSSFGQRTGATDDDGFADMADASLTSSFDGEAGEGSGGPHGMVRRKSHTSESSVTVHTALGHPMINDGATHGASARVAYGMPGTVALGSPGRIADLAHGSSSHSSGSGGSSRGPHREAPAAFPVAKAAGGVADHGDGHDQGQLLRGAHGVAPGDTPQ
jgi:hypothetical protein